MKSKKTKPVNRGRLVQASHTASEQLVYHDLRAAGAEQGDGSRVAALSHVDLAISTGRNLSTIKRAIDGLLLKGTIQLLAAGRSSEPAQYRVFSYVQILRRKAESAVDRGIHAR